jgi:hypothetical protein
MHRQPDLLEVVGAGHPAGRGPRRLHGRQEQAYEHADDRDHDQEFNERETM